MKTLNRLTKTSLFFSGLLLLSACGPESGETASDTAQTDTTKTALNDKYLTFASNTSNTAGDSSITSTSGLLLCGFGRFGMATQTFFSSPVGTVESNDTSGGTWSISVQNGGAMLDLAIDKSTDEKLQLPAKSQFAVQVGTDGSVIVNGKAAQVEDGTSECARAAGNGNAESNPAPGNNGGTVPGPVVGDTTNAVINATKAALADKHLTFSDSTSNPATNSFVTRSREIYLCGFGRFSLYEFTSFSSSGSDFTTEYTYDGTWSVSVQSGAVVVNLAITASTDPKSPAQRQFSMQTGANGSVIVNGIAATVQDAQADCAAAAGT